MRKILITFFALLWGLPALGQGLPSDTQGAGCIASATAPTFTQGYWGVLSCDLSGNLRTTSGSSGGAGGTVNQGTPAAQNTTNAWPVFAYQGGTWNLNNISGTISLPTGAATSANQTTGNTSLASIDGKTAALISGRVPVDGSGVTQPVVGGPAASSSYATTRTTGIGSTAVQVSAADTTNRRTVMNTGSVACELVQSGGAAGSGFPIGAGATFTFDAAGRTTGAIYMLCASGTGSAAVISY